LLGGAYEKDVRAVYARGGLVSYRSVLQSSFVYVPHDATVPGAVTVGDLDGVASVLAPRPLRLEAPVDGLNRAVPGDALSKEYSVTRMMYRINKGENRFTLQADPSTPKEFAAWLASHLKQ
jgi:hypothetical protein